jgi:hypothetical protein
VPSPLDESKDGDVMDDLLSAVLTGAGATAIMDAWTIVRRWLLGVPSLDYALVGRWLGHLARGRFRHDRIAGSPPIPHERVIGWSAHYATGIAFAGLLLALAGSEWIRRPSLAPALAVGIGTVLAPFLLLQPGMGAGLAASRTPRPWTARFHSVVTHAIFGLGLYVAGRVTSAFLQH